MVQQVKAYGQILQFPDGMSEADMADAISSNEHVLNPDYKPPLSDKLNALAKEHLGVDSTDVARAFTSSPSIADQAEASATEGENTAARQVPGAPVRQSTYNKALLNPQGEVPGTGIKSRIANAANEDIKGQANQQELELLRTEAMKPSESGFTQSALNSAGRTIKGAGQIGSDFFDADKDNAITQYGQKLLDNNPLWVNKLEDIKDEPFLAFKEASGNSVPSMGAMVGVSAVGAGIASLAPLTGPAAPIVAAVGTVVQWLGPAAVAALPSYSGIRDSQILKDPKNETDGKSKAIAAIGASAVGAIEVAFGPQQWAIAMLTKEGRAAMARKFASTSIGEAAIKGGLKGAVVEGSEEIVQNPIEQLASYDDPTTKESLLDTLHGGAMGALGGSFAGTVTGAASQINVDKLKPVVDAPTLDDAIVAAHEAVAPLRTEDPTLADVEALNPTNKETANETQATIDTGQAEAAKILDIVLPDNSSVKAQWKIVDADQLAASMKEDVNQPRDRTRAASDVQIKSIANAPDYRRLSDSPVMDVGAPVVDQEGRIVAGNGRFAGLSQAYEQGTATEYINQLREDAARKGLSIEGIAKPVLVRQLSEPVDTRKMAIASNSGTTLQMSALEQANLDAERMKGIENLDVNDLGDIALTPRNLTQLKDSLGSYVGTELGAMVDKGGQLSQEGMRRVRNAMLAKAYGSSPTLEKLVESTDTDMRNVLGALTKSANHIIKTKGDVKSLMEAVDTYSQLKATGQPVDNFLAQQDAFSDGLSKEAEGILRFIDTNVRSQKKLTDFFKGNFVEVDTTSDDMFEAPKLSMAAKDKVNLSEGSDIRETRIGDSTLVYGYSDGKLKLYSVRTPQAKRGTGSARRAMESFVAQADKENKTIFLDASALDKKTSTDKLVTFYKSLGFELTGKKVNPLGEPEMKRSPNAKDTNVKQLEKHLKDAGYDFTVEPASVRDVDALDSTKKARKELAEKQAKLFKKKVVFVKADGPFRINGVMVPSIADTIFVDIRTDKAFDAIMAHELSHWMEQEKPAVYKELVKSLKTVIINEAEYAKKYGIEGATKAEITKEIVGDLMGDNFTEQSFWQKVAEVNPKAFKDIAATIIKWLKGVIVKAKANGMGSEQWVKDATKAQDIIAKAVAQYTGESDTVGTEGGVKFNKGVDRDGEYLDAVNSGDMDRAQRMVNDKLASVGALWHGTPSGDLRGGRTGLHVGTKQAAMEALEARIGIPADGRGWDGTREYGETLLAGRDRVASGQFGKYRGTGYNSDSPKNDFYAKNHKLPRVGNDVQVDPNWKPWIRPVLIVGDMAKRKKTDSAANSSMGRLLSKGEATEGFYYNNIAEDAGSVSAVLPNGDYVKVKLPDAVTYDDNGEVIPLSKRFDKANNDIRFSRAYHGSPHDHNKFDSSKIGTGEGAQAYGYGHYFAESKDVAEYYKNILSVTKKLDAGQFNKDGTPNRVYQSAYMMDAGVANDDISEGLEALGLSKEQSHNVIVEAQKLFTRLEKEESGKLYEVELAPEQDEYLLWDKPLSEQSDKVKSALGDRLSDIHAKTKRIGSMLYASTDGKIGAEIPGGMNGQGLYSTLKMDLGSDKAASEYLYSLGIRGIKYLDGSSRGKGEGNFNYVVFSDDDVSITAKFSKAEKIENTLIAQHNLSVRNLIHADRMGGLAAPSIAVTDKAHPLTGFGEITLLSHKDLIDPKNGTKIFGSDIYSPRYPSISYDFSGKPIKALNALLAKGVAATGDSEYYNDNLHDDPFRELTHSSAAMYTFLSEQGVEPELAYVKPRDLPDQRLMKFVDERKDSFDLSNDDEFKATVKAIFAYKSDRDEGSSRYDMATGYITKDYAKQVVAHREAIRNAGKVDRTATNTKLFRQISDANLRNKFDEYLVDVVNLAGPKERIFQGYTYSGNRRYIAHDIDNVIKILKKDLRGGENFNYGLGSIRAKYSPQFKSIEQIRKSKGMLMNSESFDQVKKEVQAGLDGLNESLASYGTFSGYDNVETMLSDAAKRGISGALKDNGFENVPDSIKVDIQTFLNKLKDMPTEYFEAKILRAVGLGEFSTAVIPDDSTPQVEAILKKNGIEDIRKYKSGDDEDRVKQINKVTHVMFSRAPKLYSKLEQALEAANDKVFSTGPQVKLWLQSNAGKLGIKKDEIYWSGIDNWLDAQGKVSKQQVVEFVRQNGVQVEDKTLRTSPENFRSRLRERTFYEQDTDGKWYVYGDKANDTDVYDTEAEAASKVAEYNKGTSDGITKHNNDKLTLPGGPLSRDTEILTSSGWVRIDQVQIGDPVMTRKDDTGNLEWQPVLAIPKVFSETLYHFKNQSIDMQVTAEHNMVVKRRRRCPKGIFRVTAKSLWNMSECVVPLTGQNVAIPTDKLFGLDAGDVAEFVGWYLAEGSFKHRNGRKNTIQIAQSIETNPDKCSRIKALCDRLGFTSKYYGNGFGVGSKSIPKELLNMLHSQSTSAGKYIPELFYKCDTHTIKRLLGSLIMGDGHTTESKNGRCSSSTFFSKSKLLADGAQILALLSGKRASVRLAQRGIYFVRIASKEWASVDDAKHEIVDYNDVAYCVTVENHAIYVRRNGIAAFTGNSNYKELVVTVPTIEKYNESDSTHFGDTGQGKQIGWLRMDTRDGGLFIEELQSQRAQQGRSKGFQREVSQWFIAYKNGPTIGDSYNSEQEAQAELVDTFGKRDDMEIRAGERDRSSKMIGVPPAPFVSDANQKATNAYITLLMKKALIEAVSNDHASVSWTTGDQQSERYDLSKQISEVKYSSNYLKAYNLDGDLVLNEKNVPENKLQDYIGKDAAEKLIAQPKEGPGKMQHLSGVDLKVGGEWAQSMYGNEQGLNLQGKPSLMSQAANDIFKHVGSGKVESINGQPGFYVTPEMKSKDLPLFSFAGPKAETADKYALETAQQRITAGDPDDTVRRETGWFKGVDGKWRFEINDSDAKLINPPIAESWPQYRDKAVKSRYKQLGTGGDIKRFNHLRKFERMVEDEYNTMNAQHRRLSSLLDHPKLYAAYPQLRDYEVMFDQDMGKGASFDPLHKAIRIGDPSNIEAWKGVLLHEIQHGIQSIEGFASGGSPRSFAKDLPDGGYDNGYGQYKRLAGEVEARNTQGRQGMTEAERKASPPTATQDIPDSDQIVVYNGVEMRSEPSKPTPPDETRLRRFQRMNQDSFNRFTVIKEWLAENGQTLSDKADVHGAEERYHSMAANQLKDFREQQRNPLIEKIQKAGYTLGDIEVFLKMQHAQEANAQIRTLGDNPDATAYGIEDQEAADYLAEAPENLATLANEFRDITEQTKKLRLDAGILNTDITDAWEGAYKHYVPVKGEADSTRGVGKGLKTNFKSKRRLGHSLRDEHVIENILMDHERAILEVERNRVGKHLVMMAAEMQRPDILSIEQPEKRKMLKESTAYTVEANGVVQGVFKSREEAKMFKQFYAASMPKVAPSAIVINQTKDQRVIASASPMLAENEVNVYMNGHAIRVQINDELLARAYTKMGVEQFSDIVGAGRILNGYLSKVYTGYNPEFILTNMVRDFSSGFINLTGEQGIGMATKAISNYPSMFGDLLKYAASNGKSSTKWIDSYRANGGNTGAAYLSDMERLGNEVNTEYASYQGVLSNLKQGDNANAARAAGRKVFNATLKWIYNLNQAGENAMRLAAFKAMIDSGRTVNEAAKVAKNITVNFNRKGERQWAPALYLFYNASVQGTAATVHALGKGKHKGQAWALVGSMAAVGYMMAASFGGGDEDDWDEINEYTKERNMLIKSGDGYVKVPVPYGYGFFWNFGRHIAEAQRTGDLGTMPWHLATSAISEFTPFNDVVVGSDEEFRSDQVFMGLLPTAMKIVAQPTFNKQLFSGSELMPESQFDKSQPDRQKMFRSTKGTMYDTVAGWLEAAGIAAGLPEGVYDISPETLKYLVRTGTGGAGSLVDTGISAAMLKAEGAELDTQEIPFVRKGYMELGIKDKRAAYYKVREEARTAAEEFNRARRDNDVGKMQDVLKDKKELIALDRYANKLAATIDAARDQQDAVRADKNLSVQEKRLKLKDMEATESKFYDQYLDVFKASKLHNK